MKKLVVLFLFVLSCFALFSCELPGGHSCEYGEWRTSLDASCTARGEKIRYCTTCGVPERKAVDKLPHTQKTVAGRESTCTLAGISESVVCSVCDAVITPATPLVLAPHTEEIIPATDKRTEGKTCSVCDLVLVKPVYIIASEFERVEKYDGDYGLKYLESLDDADAYATLYQRMDEACDAFHNFESEADGELIIAKLDFADLGLSQLEALMVWSCYRNDRPLYYWMSGRIKYTTDQIWLMVDEDYRSETVRLDYNNRIYDRVAEYLELTLGADSHYDVALALHDGIILSADYAYEADGVTPDDSSESHNILGTLLLGRGVCESYARAYQLMLNYLEIDNIFVTGHSRDVAHAWNMVKMDDGEYYWFDLTWDDQPSHLWGVMHSYFCVSAEDTVDWYDGGDDETVFEGKHFLDNHTVDGQTMGPNFLYPIPDAAESSFTASDILIRKTTFTLGAFTFAVCGPGQVQLIKISGDGSFVIPEQVSFGGEEYEVISIGRMVQGIFQVDFITEDRVIKITVPKTVKYIFLGAFNIATLEYIEVDDDSEHYIDINGVLYSRNNLTEPEWTPNNYKN